MVTKVGQENSRRSGFVMQMSKLVADWLGAGRRTPAGVVGENLHDLHISKKKWRTLKSFRVFYLQEIQLFTGFPSSNYYKSVMVS